MGYTFTAVGSTSKTLTASATPYAVGVLVNDGTNPMSEAEALDLTLSVNPSIAAYATLTANHQNNGDRVYVMMTVTGIIPAESTGYTITVSDLPDGEADQSLTLYINNQLAITVTSASSTAGQNGAIVTVASQTVAQGDTLYFYPDAMNQQNLLVVDITGYTTAGDPHLIVEEGSGDDNTPDFFTIDNTNKATGDFVLVASAERSSAPRAITLRGVDGDGIEYAILSFNVALLATPQITVANAAPKVYSNRSWYKDGDDRSLTTLTFAATPEAGPNAGDAVSIGTNSPLYSGSLVGSVYTISIADNATIAGANTSALGGDTTITSLVASELTYTVRLVDPSTGSDVSQSFAVSDLIVAGVLTDENVQIGAYQDAAISVAFSVPAQQSNNLTGITYTATCTGGIAGSSVTVNPDIFTDGPSKPIFGSGAVFYVANNRTPGDYEVTATFTDAETINPTASAILTVYSNLTITSAAVQNIGAASGSTANLFAFTASGGNGSYTWYGTNVGMTTGILVGDGSLAPARNTINDVEVRDGLGNSTSLGNAIYVYYIGDMVGTLAAPSNLNDVSDYIHASQDTLAVTQTGGYFGFDPAVTFVSSESTITIDTVAASNSASNNPVDSVWNSTGNFYIKIVNTTSGDLSTQISFSGSGSNLAAILALPNYHDAGAPASITYTANGTPLTTIVSVGNFTWSLAPSPTVYVNEIDTDANDVNETRPNVDARSVFTGTDLAVSTSYAYALSITPGSYGTTEFGSMTSTSATAGDSSLIISANSENRVQVGYTLTTAGSHFAGNTTVTSKTDNLNGTYTLGLSNAVLSDVTANVAVISLPTSTNRFSVESGGLPLNEANVYKFNASDTLDNFTLKLNSNANDISEFTNTDGDVEYDYSLILANGNNERLVALVRINFLGNITSFSLETNDARSYPDSHYWTITNAASSDGSLIATNDYILQVRDSSTLADGSGNWTTIRTGTNKTLPEIASEALSAAPDRKSYSNVFSVANRLNYRLGIKSYSPVSLVLDDYHYVTFEGRSTQPEAPSSNDMQSNQYRSFSVGSGATLSSYRESIMNDGSVLERSVLTAWPHGSPFVVGLNLTGAYALRSYKRLETLSAV